MSLAIALVHAFILQNPQLYSVWVNPFRQTRFDPVRRTWKRMRVGGHYRRLPLYRSLIPTLNCVCKFERLAVPRLLNAPPTAVKIMRDEYGTRIPFQLRFLTWV